MNRFLTVLFAFGTAVISASALAAPEASAEAVQPSAAAAAVASAPASAPAASADAPRMEAHEAASDEFDPVKNKRLLAIAEKLRCLVCQNQTIAESNADLAIDLRRQVREQIAEGRTDDEIISYMTDRYGDFVLYKPPFKASTVILWVGPIALLVIVLAWYFVTVRRSLKAREDRSRRQSARRRSVCSVSVRMMKIPRRRAANDDGIFCSDRRDFLRGRCGDPRVRPAFQAGVGPG